MKKLTVATILLVTAGCASTASDDGPVPPVTPAPSADPRIAEMQTAMTELLERIDVLNHRIAKLEEERAAAPAVHAPAAAETSAPEVRTTATQPQPQKALVGAKIAEDYRQAIVLFGQSRYADARRAFEEVFEADSAGDLADNALFWIGETYFAAGDFANAMRFYARVVNDYADQNKAPDALFKTAMAQSRTGDLALARKTLQQVIDRYPFSSPASAAKAELQRIRY